MRSYISLPLAIIVLLIASLGYLYFKDSVDQRFGELELDPITLSSQIESGQEIPEGASRYKNERYGFSFVYPESMAIREFDENGGASTVVFEDIKNGFGFQIYIVPFSGGEVTNERFLQDIPSGVRTDITNVSIDGAVGVAFFSRDVALGETTEVWFIHDGFLFEVTSLKSLESVLSDIISTWQFY